MNMYFVIVQAIIVISSIVFIIIKYFTDNSDKKPEPPPQPGQSPTLSPSVANIKKFFSDAVINDIQTIASRCGGNEEGINDINNVPRVWEGYSLDDFWYTLDLVTKIAEPIYLGDKLIDGL